MKKILSACLILSLCLVMGIPAFAEGTSAVTQNSIAYMDLGTASEAQRNEILEAREEIIFSQTWVADGLSGCILDANGNIKEYVPEFSDLFPRDWDIPYLSPSDLEITNAIKDRATRVSRLDTHYDDTVWLTNPSDTSNTPAFCSFLTTGFPGTGYEYNYDTVYTTGLYGNPSMTAYYNVGYSNASTGASLGWATYLSNCETFTITPPNDITIAVRASTYTNVGSWGMTVTASID